MYLYKVAVYAPVFYPFIQQFFIADRNRPAVYLFAVPTISLFVEAVKETACVSCRVPERAPDNFGVFISRCTFHGFPDRIGNGAGFIKYNQDSPALVVEN